jgi:hypothetical protein
VFSLELAAEVWPLFSTKPRVGPRLSLCCRKGGEAQMATRWPDQVTAWAKAVGGVLVVVMKIVKLIHDGF